jgi:hypothetical protein
MKISITVPVIKTVKTEISFVADTENVRDMFHDKDVQQLINGNKLIAYVCAEEFLELDNNIELADFESCIDGIKIELLNDASNVYNLQQAMMP